MDETRYNAEQKRFDLHRHDVSNPDDNDQDLISQLDRHLNDAKELLGGRKRSSTSLTRGIGRSALGGSGSLEDELRISKQLNDAVDSFKLSAVLGKAKESSSDLVSLRGEVENFRRSLELLWRTQDSVGEKVSLQLSDIQQLVAGLASSASPPDEDDGSSESVVDDGFIKELHALVVSGLDILSDNLQCQYHRELSNRLRTWGVGILDGSLGLDGMFRLYSKAEAVGEMDLLRPLDVGPQIFTTPFVRILLNLEHDFAGFGFLDARSLLFLEASETLLASVCTSDELERLSLCASMTIPNDSMEQFYTYATNMYEEIERLFDLLPAVGSLRTLCCVASAANWPTAPRVSRREAEKSLKPNNLAASTLRAAEGLTAALQEKGREERLQKDKSLADHVASLFAHETERLAEWTRMRPAVAMGKDVSDILSRINRSLQGQMAELDGPEGKQTEKGKETERSRDVKTPLLEGDDISATLKQFQTLMDELSDRVE
ncbi:hypothetical protein FZEAL_8949 [Fusarium zealandicum]|uniref:Uncharacterized protein n=1 Tax=Fusarium zealandicum TaxID=1053134 RepID=A0A8H4XGB6_9HYPO|nr:hypothetical protein FZEAL_8949 [Fusarium zealandicum]